MIRRVFKLSVIHFCCWADYEVGGRYSHNLKIKIAALSANYLKRY